MPDNDHPDRNTAKDLDEPSLRQTVDNTIAGAMAGYRDLPNIDAIAAAVQGLAAAVLLIADHIDQAHTPSDRIEPSPNRDTLTEIRD